MITPSTDRGWVPEFVTVTESGELAPMAVLGKVSDVVESVAADVADAAIPLPLRGTRWGLLPASSATVSVALKVVVEFGVKVMERLQLAPAARDVPHVETGMANADTPAPVMAGEMPVRAVLPTLASVTVTGPLVVLTG